MPFYTPYGASHLDVLYNLLFCDDPGLFRTPGEEPVEPFATLLAPSPDPAELVRIARDDEAEGRVRALAFNRLRQDGHDVPPHVVLGVIVEVALDAGLDVLAAFRDGGVRYLNHASKVAVFEAPPPDVAAAARALVDATQPLVEQIGPWTDDRVPPPTAAGAVRLTMLVSDGLYFGEGPYAALRADGLGGPVLARAETLLNAVVDATVDDGPEGDAQPA